MIVRGRRSIIFPEIESIPSAKPEGKRTPRPPKRSELRPQIVILGDIANDLKLLEQDVKILPKSDAEYETRLRLMLSTVNRVEGEIRQLLRAWQEA